MKTDLTARATAFGLSALLTLAMLGGVDLLAASDPPAALVARIAPPAATVPAEAAPAAPTEPAVAAAPSARQL